MAVILLAALGIDRPLSPTEDHPRVWAAVLLVRGSVAGSAAGGFGIYVREAGDTVWSRLSRSNVITFGLGMFDNGRTRRYYAAAGNGVHRSTDGGKSWRILTSWRTEEVLCVVPDPIDSAVIYAATPFGVFKTTDDGATWEKKMKGISPWFVQRIIMDCTDRHTLYAAGERDLFKSTDAGESWVPMNAGCPNILAIQQMSSDPKTIMVAGEEKGIWRTTDGGKIWSKSAGLESASVYTFRASSDSRDVYAAGWHTGLWRSTDAGAHWTEVWDAGGVDAIYSILVDPRDSTHLMVGTVGRGAYESFDRGVTWTYAGLAGAQVKQIEIYP